MRSETEGGEAYEHQRHGASVRRRTAAQTFPIALPVAIAFPDLINWVMGEDGEEFPPSSPYIWYLGDTS